MRLSYFLSLTLFWIYALGVQAQEKQTATVLGKVVDEDGQPFPFVTIYVEKVSNASTQTDENGNYRLTVVANLRFTLGTSASGYNQQKVNGILLREGQVYEHNFKLELLSEKLEGVTVTTWDSKEADAQRATREDIKHIPSTTLNLESVLQFIAVGVSAGTGGELTTQYSVRGGNYDENLIYVNGFEIYRPLLIRSGQQEGLTFPNPDMLSHLYFSSGGFRTEYGDKMASVLDVYYRRPKRPIEGSVVTSLLGASAYIGGAIYKDSSHYQAAKETRFEEAYPYRLTYTLGVRYKTTQYLLGGLDIKGQYIPHFIDLQGNLINDFNSMWQLEILGNYSNSIYRLVPESGRVATGLFNQALRLSSNFEGQEISNFETFMLGTSLTFKSAGRIDVKGRIRMRLLASHYQSYENERIDIQGFYRLDEVETGLGQDDFGEVVGNLVYGQTHDYVRNALKSKVVNLQYRGDWAYQKYNTATNNGQDSSVKTREQDIVLKWGLNYKNERIVDDLKEWRRYDSLDYTVPFDTGAVLMGYYANTSANLNSHRLSGFIQNTWESKTNKQHWRITAGLRAQYWTLNKEFIVLPRLQLYYTPRKYIRNAQDSMRKTRDLTFKLALGSYYQPPFYREIRDLDGNIRPLTKSQKSVHALGGVVWDFVMFDRAFKFVSEVYYKHQWDLIPYDVENVRIRYYGDNLMNGYVMGLDFRLNGELVPDLESWINLSFLRARENFIGVNHKIRRFVASEIDTFDLKDVPKPTDQFFIFSMYFQDYFPKAEWFKVNLAFTVGTGLPFGIPRANVEYRNTYRYAHYHRIDMGFSFSLWNRALRVKKLHNGNWSKFEEKDRSLLHKLRNIWLSLELFNLTNNKNVASNNWIRDFTNRSYAIPNRLTSFRLNAKLRVEF